MFEFSDAAFLKGPYSTKQQLIIGFAYTQTFVTPSWSFGAQISGMVHSRGRAKCSLRELSLQLLMARSVSRRRLGFWGLLFVPSTFLQPPRLIPVPELGSGSPCHPLSLLEGVPPEGCKQDWRRKEGLRRF